VLDATDGTSCLTPHHPLGNAVCHRGGIGAERTRLNNRVGRLDVQVGDRGENPIDAEGPRLAAREVASAANHDTFAERGQCQWGWQVDESRNLLANTPFEIGRDQEGVIAFILEPSGQLGYTAGRATEEDETTGAKGESITYRLRFVFESGGVVPSECRKHEATWSH
jgi:hypothetical protein